MPLLGYPAAHKKGRTPIHRDLIAMGGGFALNQLTPLRRIGSIGGDR
jgi:hypothetical protein